MFMSAFTNYPSWFKARVQNNIEKYIYEYGMSLSGLDGLESILVYILEVNGQTDLHCGPGKVINLVVNQNNQI